MVFDVTRNPRKNIERNQSNQHDQYAPRKQPLRKRLAQKKQPRDHCDQTNFFEGSRVRANLINQTHFFDLFSNSAERNAAQQMIT